MQPATGTAPQTQQTQQAPQTGERRTMRDGRDVVYDGRGWRLVIPASGSGGGSDPTDTRGVQASAEQRGRMNIALDPVITSMNRTVQLEQQAPMRSNPFADEPFAYGLYMQGAAAPDGGPWRRQIASAMAGPDFSEEMQSYRAIEAGIIPIFSGAAVTASEAQRFLQANVPMPEDSEATVEAKRFARMQMVNGAARTLNLPPPYPEVSTWMPSGSAEPAQSAQQTQSFAPEELNLEARATSRVRVSTQTERNRAGGRFQITPAARNAYSRIPGGFDPSAPEGSAQRPRYLGNIPETDVFVGDYAITPDGRYIRGTRPRSVAIPGQRGGQGQSQPVAITSDAEYNALPSGTQFRAPDGTVRVKP